MPTAQTITKEARVAGRIVPRVIDASGSSGVDQVNAEATIITTARPSWVEELQPVEIWARNSSTGQGQLFGGEIVKINWKYAPGQVAIYCRDLLARTRYEWQGGEYEYTNQDDAAIIRNLLEKMGIPSSMASIESSGWTLGTIEPILLQDGDVPYSIIEAIDDLAGYKTYSLPSGVIVRRRVSGAPGAAAALTFSKGVNILNGAGRERMLDGIANRFSVTGVEYQSLTVPADGPAVASAPNPYIPNPPGFIGKSIQSNLIETDEKAQEIADRKVADGNRRPEAIDFSAPLDPRAQPGMTVGVVHPDLEAGSVLAFGKNVAWSINSSGAITTIRTSGGNLGGTTLQAPAAVFAIQTFLEGEDTGAGVTPIVVVVCDGSQSYDPDGAIASYAWSVTTDGTATPSSGSGAIFRATLEGATTLEVTLTVTDGDAETGTLTLEQAIDTSAMYVEDLYLAFGDMSCSSDGEQSWRDETPASGSATCLAPIAPTWQAWGTTTGHIYASFDKLATPAVDFGAPHGAVACTAIWIQETDDTRLWAGFADGKVYFGTVDTTAYTCTFSLAGTIPEGPVVEVRESYGALGELRATAGTGYYYSADAGQSWSLQHTFDTAWRMAAGFDTNLTSGLNDAAPLYSESGAPPTVPGGVTHIRGISFGWREQELYAADDAANLYLGPAPDFNLALHADSTAAIVNHMIRSGNIDRVVYMAVGDGTGDNGFQKWIPGAVPPFWIRKTGTDAGLMIGYGALRPLDAPHTFIYSDTTAKTLSLWNGASNDTAPSGWESIGFDASGWNTPVVVASPSNVPVTGADPIWPSDPAASASEAALFRQSFTLPPGAVLRATLFFRVDDNAEVYINGTHVHSGDIFTIQEIALDPAVLIAGSLNVIAVVAVNGTATEAWASYAIEVNG